MHERHLEQGRNRDKWVAFALLVSIQDFEGSMADEPIGQHASQRLDTDRANKPTSDLRAWQLLEAVLC
jgi:hypothetical protein